MTKTKSERTKCRDTGESNCTSRTCKIEEAILRQGPPLRLCLCLRPPALLLAALLAKAYFALCYELRLLTGCSANQLSARGARTLKEEARCTQYPAFIRSLPYRCLREAVAARTHNLGHLRQGSKGQRPSGNAARPNRSTAGTNSSTVSRTTNAGRDALGLSSSTPAVAPKQQASFQTCTPAP